MSCVFERREDLALSPFRENGAATHGPREALRALQESLQRIGVLAPPRRLKHISEAELNAGMRHACSFIETYGPALINLDLLQ